jgi:hypothetical protein
MSRKQSHRFVGENTAFGVSQWMNATRSTPENQRVLDLLESTQRLQRLQASSNFAHVDLRSLKVLGTKSQKKKSVELGKLLRTINKEIGGYTFRPRYYLRSVSRGDLEWAPVVNRTKVNVVVSPEGDRYPMTEDLVVGRILELAKQGLVHRLRRCRRCRLWYFAHFTHQRFCGRRCQQANFRQSENFKMKRRVYMRKHRREEYEKNRKAKEEVRRKSRGPH